MTTTRSLLVLALVALTPQLHGCFPVVAAGAGTAVLVAEDRRTTGIYLEDQNIELKTATALKNQFGGNDKVHINVTSYNRYVLLTGEVPDEETKKEAGVTALGIENVRNVQNELVLGPVTSFSQRATDGYTTSKVKGRFVSEAKFQANHVKVVTDNNSVYLMGLVTSKEADDATEIARTTGGVTKVVRVFEITE
jgi:osmotically-inducible protein OsmY